MSIEPIGEICAGCGKEIGMLEGSYYRKGPNDDIGKSFHSFCGDPFGIAAKVAAEREACAKIADDWLASFGDRKPEHVSAQKWACDAIKDIADAIRARARQPEGGGA